MLKYIQYQTSEDFFEQYSHFVSSPLVICPNPQKADEARSRFERVGASLDCLTISKFMQDQIGELLDEETLGLRKNKSALTLFLGAIWKKLKGETNYMEFVQAFNIFTELRSYSVETSVIEGVLELYDDSLAEIIIVFQKVMTDLDIIDEHGAYNLLTQRIREGDLPVDHNLPEEVLLYGFETMTASQLDLLKILSTRTKIGLLIHEHLLETSTTMDWVGWLKTDLVESVPALKREPSPVKAFEYSPGFLAHSLPREHDVVILGAKKNQYHYIQEIPYAFQYKQSVDLFSHAFKTVWRELEEYTGPIERLKNYLIEKISEFSTSQKYFEIKVCLVILNKLSEWEEISDENQSLGHFDLKIIRDASELDLPRLNKFDPNGEGVIRDLSQTEGLTQKKVALVIGSQYQRLKFSDHNYTDSIEAYLAAIGPLRRSDFEFNLYLAKLKELITLNQVDLFIEQGLLKSEKQWKRLLDHFDFDAKPVTLNLKSKTSYYEPEVRVTPLERVSSSRLQVYTDCPKKYYFSYIEKLEPRIHLKEHLDSMELGQIQHKIIEVYLSNYKEFDEAAYLKTLNETLESFLEKKNQVQIEGIMVETRAYTQKIISALLEISKDLQLKIEFERDFNFQGEKLQYIGSVDCFGTGTLLDLVLDFKRSGFSFSSQTNILEFEKNQLWFYLSRLKDLGLIVGEKPIVFGYIDLSDLSNSLLFSNDKEVLSLVTGHLGGSRTKVIEDLASYLNDYRELEDNLLDELIAQKAFPPSPRDTKVCDFCFLNATCSRGGLNG
ncbi:MAG: hypothetical protein CME65_07000 [Halobacteriovoraceae bacterium]|nr:hypothetical protein [Halobacteriovoraceae bacterium]|tara:strand:+ start:6375 stop:8711 length:2337 start_codon:yes stop_codon:yes gene_type:complete